jgi:hydroxymethylglutaryl-CoA synthase
MEVHIPGQYFAQSEKEVEDGCEGKYTQGLGQKNCTYCADNEDVVSMALTVVRNMLLKGGVDPAHVGRIDVGTETPVDQCKSLKSMLLQLFEGGGAHSIEGSDVYNACYGGTAALLNAIAWVQSKAWDGRLALVVASDISVQPTEFEFFQGAAAVCMVVGPNAPVVMEQVRSCYMEDTFDFIKPTAKTTPYPIVANNTSIQCYLHALDMCQEAFRKKLLLPNSVHLTSWADYLVLHSPNARMAYKAADLLLLRDSQVPPHPREKGTEHADLVSSHEDLESL